jgi:hypothetical protein
MVECSRCGEEVRYGKRGLTTGWLHRVDGDHVAILGHIMTPEEAANLVHQDREVVRYFDDGTSYTTAEFDILRDKDVDRRKRRLAELHGTAVDAPVVIPEPEVPQRPVTVDDFAPRSGTRQVFNLVAKQGWEMVSATFTRGPYLGADGSVLSISDCHVQRSRGPRRIDGSLPVAVASWRDGSFDFAYVGVISDGRLESRKVDSNTMKKWIKGIE